MKFVILIFLITNHPYDFYKIPVHYMWTAILEKKSNNSINVHLFSFVFSVLKLILKKNIGMYHFLVNFMDHNSK